MIIDGLPEITIANDTDEIAIEQGTSTKKIKKSNFLQEVLADIQTLISSLSDKVSKAGDTMTGNLTINNTSPGVYTKVSNRTDGTAPSTTGNATGFRLTDKNNTNVAVYADHWNANGQQGAWLAGYRNGIANSLYLVVDDNGHRVVRFSELGPWRSALGLTYSTNDTFSVTSSLVLNGLIGNTTKTTVYLDCVVDGSMENISTISVTSMTGYFSGANGRDNPSGTTDYTGTGYSIACTKQGNHHVRIAVTKTSAFSIGDAFTPVAYFGTITLKFT